MVINVLPVFGWVRVYVRNRLNFVGGKRKKYIGKSASVEQPHKWLIGMFTQNLHKTLHPVTF